MADVKISFVGDDANLVQRIEKQQAAIGKLTERLRQMKTQGRQATKDVGGGLADGARQALAFAGALTGVGTAAGAIMAIVRQLKAEYEALRARQERAANAQVTLAEARSMATLQRPAEISAQQLEGMVGRISGASGLTQADVWRGLPGPLSAMGSATPAQFESAMTLGARIRARAGQGFDMGTFVGGTLDIMRATGVQEARQGLGFVRQFGTAARMEDVQSQVRALAPALTAGMEAGASPEQVAELLAYISQRTADPEGMLSSTAAINLMMATQKPVVPRTILGRQKFFLPEGATYDERIAALRSAYQGADEATRVQILSKIGGRAKTKGAIMGFLGEAPGAMGELAAAQGRIGAPTAPGLGGLTDQLLSEIEAAPVQTVRLAGQQAQERMQLLNEQAAMAAEVRNQIDALIRDTEGVTDIQRKYIMGKFEAASRFGTRNAGAAAVEAIRSARSTKMLAPWRYAMPGFFGTEWMYAPKPPGAIQAERGVYGARGFGGEPNPAYNPDAARVLETLEAAIREQTKRLDEPQKTVLVGDERSKQYGGASPHGE